MEPSPLFSLEILNTFRRTIHIKAAKNFYCTCSTLLTVIWLVQREMYRLKPCTIEIYFDILKYNRSISE